MLRNLVVVGVIGLFFVVSSTSGCSCDGGGGLGNCPDEICNGVDDDCDGQTDEDDAWAEKGETCFVGLGACSAAGVFICDETNRTGPLVCSGAPGSGETEICNGVDDDCDGETDEESQWSNRNEVCRVVEGGCEGVGIFICDPLDPDAPTICDAVAGPPTTEVCDGLDNDCDGDTDEGADWADKGSNCTNGVGTCERPGLITCDPADPTGPTLCGAVAAPAGTEVCNGLDDDCDGQTDEDALWADKGAVCTSGQGICETPGIRLCDPANPAGPTVCSASQTTSGAPETCNGLDDDCDGQTDEDATWADKGSLCSRGLGACQRTGVLGCDPANAAGPTICNAIEGIPATEVCDRVDNDCDGLTDEEAAWADLGDICREGSGSCENVGVRVCDTANPAGATVCSVSAGGGSAEVCNGLDDDCDGATDEEAAWSNKGTVCTISTGQCEATGTFGCDTTNPAGPTVCSATAGASTAEVCNALDDDCDGSTDEDATWADKGTVCTSGLGVCEASGTLGCDTANPAGPTVCSATPGASGVEVCNGLDDDCDGLTDEDATWSDKGDICTTGIGQCASTGTRTCDSANPAGPTVCTATVGTGSAELCNGLDDDCDGLTDEDATWADKGQSCTSGTGQCTTGGLQVCDTADPAGPTVCSATPGASSAEVCNGLDDDCDGSTDEGALWTDKDDVCTDGVGACEVVGVLVCDTGNPAGGTVCSAVAGPGSSEICDGLDNDCDGLTDEDAAWADRGTVCTDGTGQCVVTGVKVCDTANRAGPTVCSVTASAGSSEVCNGLDDDCDGSTDEDAAWADKGTVCTNGAGTCETTGTKICDTGNPAGPTVCSAIMGPPGTEVCNGLDDDCDGGTDEGLAWADKGDGCTAGNGQCAASGVRVCDTADPAGPTVCSATPGASSTEVCNGLDDDCDGSTDEITWADKGTICTEGAGACQQTGVRVCDTASPAGPTVCSVTAGGGSAEVCNGLDDDCDGSTDENLAWADKGTVCIAGTGVCEAVGVKVCDTASPAGPTVCSATAGAGSAEVCNSLDDDCDGSTDELAWADKGSLCSVGLGQCAATGTRVCDTGNPGGPTVCSATAGATSPEVCNDLDDDCDGSTDEIVWADKGSLCSDGLGQCTVTGTRICDTGNPGGPTVCSVTAGGGSAEVCNDLDDDCDGSTDELVWADKGNLCSVGLGQCAATGTRVCDTGNPGGPTVCSATPGGSSAEICNDLDDDCDGATDELTWADKGDICTAGNGACERTGTRICDTGSPGGPTICSVTAGGGSTEVCNGLDDDCDGGTDEISWADLGTGCIAGDGVCAQPGIKVCDTGNPGGPTVCSATPGAAGAEVCNDLDDDCDTQTDEVNWIDKGDSCSQGQGVCEAAGILICNVGNPAGPTVCSATAGVGGAEICNGLDDDCDETVDDNLTAPGCAEQDGVCSGSTQNCGGGLGWQPCTGPEYGADYEPTELSCDGLDNSCDGSTDTGLPSQPCASQQGVCAGSLATCSLGAWQACGAAEFGPDYQPVESLCDLLDNDCDGNTDEGWLAAGKYYQDTACGNCFTDCTTIFAYPDAYGTCDSSGAPTCQMTCCSIADTHPACDGLFDYYDLDGVPGNGCEFQNDPGAIYVSTPGNGGADGPACGPSGSPCATIEYGISQASSGGQARVKVSGGAYYENFSLEKGIDVLGGYNPTTWARNIAANTTVIYGVGGPVATPDDRSVVSAVGINAATEFGGFVIFGEISTGVGGNSFGIYVEDSDASLTIRDNLVYAGDGGPGVDALDGSTGSNGIDGSGGVAAYDDASCPAGAGSTIARDPGGAGGGLSCSGTNVSGGSGGTNYCPDYDESGTQPLSNPFHQYPEAAMDGAAGNGPTPGTGGITGWDSVMFRSGSPPSCACYTPPDDNEPTGTTATNGGNGGGGNGGSGCTTTDGTLVGIRWQGLIGAPGIGGQPGSGGGGGGAGGGVENIDCNSEGGSDVGASGGGGGSGGCGGGGGGGGEGGGGSFGLYLAFTSVPTSVPNITGNTFNTGLGGTGGNGGNGGFGGIGGTGGAGGLEGQGGTNEWCAGGGGRGGEGGNGGAGGGGGGGCGGVSYGIFSAGQGGVNLNAIRSGNTYVLSGSGGTGGAGGLSLSVAGSDGLAGTEADTNF